MGDIVVVAGRRDFFVPMRQEGGGRGRVGIEGQVVAQAAPARHG